MKYFSVFCLLILLTLTSCFHYRFGTGGIIENYQTISIPYVEGDQTGELTNEIIHKISTSGSLKYTPCGGELLLKIKWIDLDDEQIGFRYDRHKDGRLKNTIIPVETRLYATVLVELIDQTSREIVLGPTQIFATIDYDHDYYKSRNGINVFSLGQLVDIDEAQETALKPLYTILAEKITEYVLNSW